MPELLAIVGLIVLTPVGLFIARRLRERHDAAVSEATGWRFRSQLPITLEDPYDLFSELYLAQPFDVREGRDENFEVSYFETRAPRRPVRPCAIVRLPVDGPTLDISGGVVPPGVGPRTASVLRDARGVSVKSVPSALLVKAVSAPKETVERTALALAKAIVADAQAAAGADPTAATPTPARHAARPDRIFG